LAPSPALRPRLCDPRLPPRRPVARAACQAIAAVGEQKSAWWVGGGWGGQEGGRIAGRSRPLIEVGSKDHTPIRDIGKSRDHVGAKVRVSGPSISGAKKAQWLGGEDCRMLRGTN